MTDPFPGGQSGGSNLRLRESLLKAKIAKLPHLPAVAPFRETSDDGQKHIVAEEEEEDTLGSLSYTLSKGTRKPLRNVRVDDDEFSPTSAKDCFEQALEVEVDNERSASSSSSDRGIFRVYYTPPRRRGRAKRDVVPSFSIDSEDVQPFAQSANDGVTNADDDDDDDEEDDESANTVFLFHHGAGYSALSFALVAKSITQLSNGKAGVLAYDCRGHGKTRHACVEQSQDLSLERLTRDGLSVLEKLFPPHEKQPTLVLVGHSMGGAVVVSMAHALGDANRTSTTSNAHVAGVAVLDVVEGTAMEALPSMKLIVSQLPKGFDSVEDAIRWHVDSGTIVNAQSARRSVPSLLKEGEGKLDATEGKGKVDDEPQEELIEVDASSTTSATTTTTQPERPLSSFKYVWRHDLLATEPYWSGWFTGLSKAFLSVKCARLLVLAGTDRLDKELMIGQMQGKYQLVVFPEVGHSLQEDAPQKTAQTLVDFWRRNESVNVKAIKGLRKVGQA